jgi:hypothetical protein
MPALEISRAPSRRAAVPEGAGVVPRSLSAGFGRVAGVGCGRARETANELRDYLRTEADRSGLVNGRDDTGEAPSPAAGRP